MKSKFTISDAIQTGILFTLLGIAYSIGETKKTFEMMLNDHERRIAQLEM